MRWPLFVLLVFLALSLETGLRGLLQIGGAAPSLLLILLVYVGLSAPPLTVAWAAVVLGVLVDLGRMSPGSGLPLDIVGPGVLGYGLAGYTAIQLRALVFRDSSVTVAISVFFAGLMMHLMVVAILTTRGLGFVPGEAIAGWSAADQLVQRFLDLLYTTVVALPVGKLLIWSDPVWGFTFVGGAHRKH